MAIGFWLLAFGFRLSAFGFRLSTFDFRLSTLIASTVYTRCFYVGKIRRKKYICEISEEYKHFFNFVLII